MKNYENINIQGLGRQLKKDRLSANISAEKVAKILGLTKAMIYRYESGIVTWIPFVTMVRFSKLYNQPISNYVQYVVSGGEK